VLFRVLRGVGVGMIRPLAQLIMAQIAGPQRMGRVMGVVSMPAMLAPILGPVVGGVILQNLHWSWIFFVNVPIGFVAFILGWRMLPRTDSGEAGRLDWVGLALMPTGAAATVYGLSKLGAGAPFGSPEVLVPVILGAVLGGAFVMHALRIDRPLLDVRLYANRVFAGASLTTFGVGAALFGAMILVPLYYQEVRGLSIGLSFMPAMTAAFASMRPDQLSDATPQINVLMRLGGAIGTAILAVVLQRSTTGHTPADLAHAFNAAYVWALGIALLSLIPCLMLLRAEHPRARSSERESHGAEAAPEPMGL
jgi:MFS family permease